MAHGAGAGAAHSRGTGRGCCDSAGVAALRDGSGQGGSALHLLLHASWCGAARALSCRADRAAEEDVSGAGESRSFASLRMTRLGETMTRFGEAMTGGKTRVLVLPFAGWDWSSASGACFLRS